MVMGYLEMSGRTEVLNKRLDMLRELLDVLQQQVSIQILPYFAYHICNISFSMKPVYDDCCSHSERANSLHHIPISKICTQLFDLTLY